MRMKCWKTQRHNRQKSTKTLKNKVVRDPVVEVQILPWHLKEAKDTSVYSPQQSQQSSVSRWIIRKTLPKLLETKDHAQKGYEREAKTNRTILQVFFCRSKVTQSRTSRSKETVPIVWGKRMIRVYRVFSRQEKPCA